VVRSSIGSCLVCLEEFGERVVCMTIGEMHWWSQYLGECNLNIYDNWFVYWMLLVSCWVEFFRKDCMDHC